MNIKSFEFKAKVNEIDSFDKIILSVHHLSPQFFDLKTSFAGELLQKCANFRMQLVIVGDVTPFSNDRFNGFIGERNKGDQVNFAKDEKEFIEACKVSYESMLNC